MKKKNILIVLPRYHTNYFHTIEALQKNGHKVKLFVYNKSKIEDHSNIKPLQLKQSKLSIFISKVLNKQNKMNKYYFPKFSVLKKKLNNFCPDIILIRSVNKIYLIMLLILRIKFKYKIFIYLQASLNNLTKSNLVKKFLIFTSYKYFNIKYYSPIFEKKIINNFFFYLPFAMQIKNLRKRKKYNFLNIGKFIKKKNHIYFVKAVEKLSYIYPIKSLIIGEVSNQSHKDNLDKIKGYVKKKKLQKIIKFKINVNPRSMKKYYSLYPNYIHTASQDPAPISIIEALSFNNRVLCTRSCGTKNYIKKGLNGKIIHDKDLDKLHLFMREMLFLHEDNIYKRNITSVFKNH